MDGSYSGLIIVPIITGLVEAARRLGLPLRYAAPFAVAVGLSISLASAAAAELPGGPGFMEAVLRGLAHGLSGVGLHWTFRPRQDETSRGEERR
jgi:hypothetical protein